MMKAAISLMTILGISFSAYAGQRTVVFGGLGNKYNNGTTLNLYEHPFNAERTERFASWMNCPPADVGIQDPDYEIRIQDMNVLDWKRGIQVFKFVGKNAGEVCTQIRAHLDSGPSKVVELILDDTAGTVTLKRLGIDSEYPEL